MAKFNVVDPLGAILPVAFQEEKAAITFKLRMEKETGRVFRMEKIFDSCKNHTPQADALVSITLCVPPGEEIVFSSGAVMHSTITGKTYRVKRARAMSGGGFEAIVKEEVVENAI